jgi:hypothetical protein
LNPLADLYDFFIASLYRSYILIPTIKLSDAPEIARSVPPSVSGPAEYDLNSDPQKNKYRADPNFDKFSKDFRRMFMLFLRTNTHYRGRINANNRVFRFRKIQPGGDDNAGFRNGSLDGWRSSDGHH